MLQPRSELTNADELAVYVEEAHVEVEPQQPLVPARVPRIVELYARSYPRSGELVGLAQEERRHEEERDDGHDHAYPGRLRVGEEGRTVVVVDIP